MNRHLQVLAAALIACASTLAAAQYPNKPIKLDVPLAAAGTGDTLAPSTRAS